MSTALTEMVVGSWSLVSFEQESQNGQLTYPLGREAKGSIFYLPNGHVSVNIMRQDRDALIDRKLFEDGNLRYSNLGYLAYSGTFHIDEDNKMMTHDVSISLYPEWVGHPQIRVLKLEGEFLLLSSDGPVGSDKDIFRLKWKRD
jgi:hypothetical protein